MDIPLRQNWSATLQVKRITPPPALPSGWPVDPNRREGGNPLQLSKTLNPFPLGGPWTLTGGRGKSPPTVQNPKTLPSGWPVDPNRREGGSLWGIPSNCPKKMGVPLLPPLRNLIVTAAPGGFRVY